MTTESKSRAALEEISKIAHRHKPVSRVWLIETCRAALAATPPTEQVAVPTQIDDSVIRRLAHQHLVGTGDDCILKFARHIEALAAAAPESKDTTKRSKT